jgi:hypothetical protein
MKNPPSASVKPPTQTTQRVPMRSSKPGPGCDAAAGMSGIGGGGAGWLGGASASVVSILISSGSDGAIGASRTGIGGGMDVVAAVDASIASSRARSMAA